MKQRGRKSAAELSVAAPIGDISRPKAPASLDKSAAALWDRIMAIYPQNHFNAADLQLLREFCHVSATLLPQLNSEQAKFGSAATLRTRSMLVKEAAAIAGKLRLCVSSRTRGDLAAIRNAGKPQVKPWERQS